MQQIRCAVISNVSSLQLPEDFKSGALSQTVVFDYGLPGQEAEINGLKIRSATWTITDRNAIVSNILQPQVNAATGEIIYQNFKIKVSSATYNNNSGVSPFEHFRRYLMPQNVDEVKNEFNQVVNRLTGKSTLTDLDINYIKAIASCGSKYFSPLSKYKIIRKISDHSLFITEYYEDLILDLLETYQGDVTVYSAEMLRLLKSDHLLLKRLFYNMSNESGQVFKNGSEENFTRFLQVLFGLWVNTPLADQSKYLYDDFIPIGGNQYTPHVISYNGDTWFPRITYENYRFTESGLFIDTKSFQGKYGVYKYDFFQPVTIIFEKSSVTKITRLEVPAIYFAGQTRVDNLERTLDQLGLTVDVALTVSGVGNITKLRHLSTLRQFGKVLLGTIELTSGAADIILNYSNYCYGNEEFCETFKEYNT
ncbi:MAG: hypothetical protein EBU52_06150, partial [Cytophagia bacterium]|nr:hypothetical protein [Cytophagia bacterium]